MEAGRSVVFAFLRLCHLQGELRVAGHHFDGTVHVSVTEGLDERLVVGVGPAPDLRVPALCLRHEDGGGFFEPPEDRDESGRPGRVEPRWS